MHEFSIAEDILESALEEAEKHKATTIKRIHVTVGELLMARLDQLEFALKSLAVDTIAEDMDVKLKTTPPKFKCENEHISEIHIDEDDIYLALASLKCPVCKKPLQVLSGKECILEKIIAE